MPPLVTVIIPSYNYGRFIGQALQSVGDQTYPQWECLVIDDGSTDDTREVVARTTERDSRVKYVFQENRRAGAARNNGLRLSGGTYLQFLDADDLIAPQKLERQVEYLERHPETDIVYGPVRYLHPDAVRHDAVPPSDEVLWMPRLSGGGRESVLGLIRLPLIIHSALVRKGAGEAIVYFDERLKACEDWLYWVTSALWGKRFEYVELEGTYAFYRAHLSSACTNRPLVDDETRRLRKILDTMITDGQARELNRRLAAEYEGNLGINEVIGGRVARGMRQLLRAGLMSPTWREKMKWLFCAAVAPMAPRREFQKVVAAPVSDAMAAILRHRCRAMLTDDHKR